MSHKLPLATVEAIVKAYTAGRSEKDIAADVGASKATVQAALARCGVMPRPRGRPGDPERDARLVAAWDLCGRAGRQMVADDFGYASIASAKAAVHCIRHGRRHRPLSSATPISRQ